MSYVDERNAAARITSASVNSNTLKGLVGARMEGMVERDPRRADGSIYPVSRPQLRGDSISIFRFLDPSSVRPPSDSAGNAVTNFSEGSGGAGSVTMGPYLPSGYVHDFDAQAGGYVTDQTFEMEGSALTHTVVV